MRQSSDEIDVATDLRLVLRATLQAEGLSPYIRRVLEEAELLVAREELPTGYLGKIHSRLQDQLGESHELAEVVRQLVLDSNERREP
jgi:hypothetical protein